MTRYKTHLIAVKKFNTKDDMIMRDIREAMEYLAVIMNRQSSTAAHQIQPLKSTNIPHLASRTPATHIYCYDATVLRFPLPKSHN